MFLTIIFKIKKRENRVQPQQRKGKFVVNRVKYHSFIVDTESLLLLGRLFILLLGSRLGKGASEQVELGRLLSDWGDEVLSMEILDQSTGNGSRDLVLFAKDRSSHTEELWNVLEHGFVLRLLKIDGVVKLLLNLDLSPRLLLTLGSSGLSGSFLL